MGDKFTDHWFQRNAHWAKECEDKNPDFFRVHARKHKPACIWIGCSDARVSADIFTEAEMGEIFVHRNVANCVSPQDLSLMSLLYVGINILGVKDLVVCGHYGCLGLKTAVDGCEHEVTNSWLADARRLYQKNQALFTQESDPKVLQEKLVEMHVEDQICRLSNLDVIRKAWADGIPLALHGWVFSIETGRLKDLQVTRGGN